MSLPLPDDLEEQKKGPILFGRDIGQIPCFRSSFLYGISGGIGTGILAFLGTSRTKLSTHIGFGTFFSSTFLCWFWCRYQWSQKKFHYSRLQAAMKQQALYEGTDLERENNLEECSKKA